MAPTRSFFSTAVALVAIAACGGSSSTSAPTGAGSASTDTTSSDITTYQDLADQTLAAASAYRGTTAATGFTTATCKSIHDQYDAEVRPWISRMMQMAAGMDGWMGDHGSGADADMMCGSATMMDELDYHRSVACTLPSLGADRDEAARHAAAIDAYAGHLGRRCGQMLGADGGWEPMMNGCESWSTTCCSGMMHGGCCGGMMGGGGMMMHGTTCCETK